MPRHLHGSGALRLLALAVLPIACGDSTGDARSKPGNTPGIVARFAGGELSVDDVRREQERLPPALRDRFEGKDGLVELARGVVDKRLLVLEARRRGFADDPAIAREVRELEERLIVQALLRAGEAAAGAPSEDELRAHFDAHRGQFREPASAKIDLLQVTVTGGVEGPARARAERFAARLAKGEAAAEVARGGGADAERSRIARWIARGDLGDRALEEAAFALSSPGEISPVIRTATGFAVVQLIERRGDRPRTFEEARTELEARVGSLRQRAAFDSLLKRLREDARIEIAADQLH